MCFVVVAVARLPGVAPTPLGIGAKSDDATHDRRIAGAQRVVQTHHLIAHADREARGRQLDGRHGAAAYLGAIVRDAHPQPLAQGRCQAPQRPTRAAPHRGERFRQHAQGRHRLEGRAGLVRVQRRLEGRDRELVDPERAVPGILLEPGHDGAATDDDPGLGPAEELVAGEGHQVHSGGHRLLHRGLVREAPGAQIDERPRAEILHDGDPPLPPELDELAGRHLGGEPHDPVVGGVDLEQERRGRRDCLGVVPQVGPVRRAHFTEDRAAAQHDVGDAEFATDLDQLAARDDDLPTVRQRLKRQQDCRGVVVDHQRVLGGGQPLQERLHVAVP